MRYEEIHCSISTLVLSEDNGTEIVISTYQMHHEDSATYSDSLVGDVEWQFFVLTRIAFAR